MNKNIQIAAIFALAALFVVGKPVLSHGAGASFPKDVGNYTIEFEYEYAQITAGETNVYIFRLSDQKTKAPVVFDSVLTRFERKSDQATYIVARVTQDELQEGVGRLTTILNEGDYAVTAGFYKGENKLAEASYDLSVKRDDSARPFPIVPVASALGGLIVGFGIAKFKRAPNEN